MEVIYRRSPFSVFSNPFLILSPKGWLDALGYTRNYVVLTDDAVILKRGVLNKKSVDIPYDKINSIRVEQGLIGRFYHFGDVIIMSGNDVVGEAIKGIINPDKLKHDVQERINSLGKHARQNHESHSQSGDNFDQLEKLAQLKKKGIITEKEFETKKKQLLNL